MRLDLKEIIALAVPYLAVVSAAYLFGYWGAFNVSVLDYIGVADIVKISVYPLFSSLIYVIAGFLISEILRSPALPPGGGAETPIGRFGRRYWRPLLAAQVLLIVLLAVFGNEPWRWFLVAFLIGLFSTPLSHVGLLVRLVPEPRVRAALLFYVLILPAISFAYGRFEAHVIKTGHPTNVVDLERSKLPLKGDQQHPVSNLGFIGGIYVLFESTSGQVVFVQQGSTPLYVTPRKR